jgi:predicted ATP-grasp superfamily ATP-dependent carboligase
MDQNMTSPTATGHTGKWTPSHRAQRSGTTNPAAVIIGLDSLQGLQAARILAARDIPVIGIAADSKNALSKTNVCKEIIIAPTAQEELISHLLQIGARLDEKAVLFPCEDTNVSLVSRHRKQLERCFHVLLPEPDVVEMLMDKVRFYSFARENELPIPRTYFIENRNDIRKAAKELIYPCVLKPRDSAARTWEDETIFKAFKIYDADELIATHNHYQTWTDCFIVQEWIEGDDSNLYSCNCYFDRNSEPLVTFVARKLRQWPPETGISCLGEEVRNDIVLDQTLRLFRSVNYRGLGYLEMKRDRRTGKYFIVEPNIGRPTGRSAIAEAGGVELLHTAYCDALGLPLPENRKQTYQGVKWIHWRKDIQSSIFYWKRGELTFLQWWRSLQGKKACAIGSWQDPWPFLCDWFAAVRSFLSPRRRKKRVHKGRQAKLLGIERKLAK